MTNRYVLLTALAAVAGGIVSASNADVIASLTYDDLAGSWNGATFTAVAVDNGAAGIQSAGQASRLVNPVGDAQFGVGFTSRTTAAFSMNLTATPVDAITKNGSGSFTATDINGDTITGRIDGQWMNLGNGFVTFNGALSNVNFNAVHDNNFDGEVGSFLNVLFPGQPPYEGATASLLLNAANFFDPAAEFANAETGTLIQITPAPGSLALLGLGGLAAARRRR